MHRSLHIVESAPCVASYQRVMLLLSDDDVRALKQEYPDLVVRPARPEEMAEVGESARVTMP
jgi:hypothetical protein